jgi:hypothetical protein
MHTSLIPYPAHPQHELAALQPYFIAQFLPSFCLDNLLIILGTV